MNGMKPPAIINQAVEDNTVDRDQQCSNQAHSS